MPESYVQLPANSTGAKVRTRQRLVGANTVEEQFFIPGSERVVSFRGRAGTFRIPGRAATANGRTLWQIWNGAGSGVLVAVEAVATDIYQTVVKAVTVPPPTIRLYRTTTALTGGAALAKVALDTAQGSSGVVALLQDGTADGTIAATPLGAAASAAPAGSLILTQEFAPRMITAVGYEMMDRSEFLGDTDSAVILREGQGAILRVDYPAATSDPITDMWVSVVRWSEFTLP